MSEKVDARCDRMVAAIAAEQWGIVRVAQVLGCGLSYDAILARKRTGRLHELYRGVLAVGHANPPRQGRLLAAVFACGPAAVLSHHSAAALWGFADRDDDRHPEVTVVGSGTRLHPGIRVHRTTVLVARDIARCEGVPITGPARTLLDRAAQVDERTLRAEARRAQGLKRVNHRQLTEVLHRLGPRRGSRQLASILANGPQPTRTVLEDVVLDLLLEAGFEHPDVNKPLRLGGRVVIPDFRWSEAQLVVEADGATWHDHKVAREDDAERQALLEAHGERVLRVTWAQAIGDRVATITRIRSAGAPSAASRVAFDPKTW